MRIARMIDPAGSAVLVKITDGHVVPLHESAARPGRDVLREALAVGVDLDTAQACGEAVPLGDVRLTSPVTAPEKIIAIGLNYADHARESGIETPSTPVAFAKFPNSIVGPDEAIRFRTSDSSQVDYEAELAVVIGRRCRNIVEADALAHVLGYTVCNDVSARDAQFADGQWVRGKSFDTFCPLGPWIMTADELPDPQTLDIRCRVNGETMQDSNTKEMIFGVAELIGFLSRYMTLEPGDVIATGTPYGVGFARTPAVYLGNGDVVEVEIDGLGLLRNPVVTA